MPANRVERKLVAILAADVAGYSRLMSPDEEGTLARLKAHRRELIDPKISEHRGRIVKTTGDGVLVEFASPVEAARCAIEVQRSMVDRNADLPPYQRLEFRVGINLGDIMVEAGDIYGDGVNVAARLEALAEPGGICISGTVRDQIRDKLPHEFDDQGEQAVKNIARPVRIYGLSAKNIAGLPRFTMAATAARSNRKRVLIAAAVGVIVIAVAGVGMWQMRLFPYALPGRTTATFPGLTAPHLSIVVLPFTNLSSNPDQEYFADGITDDLTTDLSRISGSFVIARNTAFTYRGKAVDIKQIGRELGVRYILEGSVRRDGDKVRVNAQLIDAEEGAHVWADRFDKGQTDVFELQNDVTRRIAQALHLELIRAESQRARRTHTDNPDAIDLAMRGWATFYRPRSREQIAQARDLFEQALRVDPQSAEALLGLSRTLTIAVLAQWSDASADDLARRSGRDAGALDLSR
jgi:TolB-like protein/class 3 adenylate cyclase